MIRDGWSWRRAWRHVWQLAVEDEGLGVARRPLPEGGEEYLVACGALRDPARFGAALSAWRAQLLEGEGECLSRSRAHTVFRLVTAECGSVVLKRVESAKPYRRYAIPTLLAGWRLHRAVPGSVPEPLGAYERYNRWGRLQEAWLVARYEPGHSLRTLLRQPGRGSMTALARSLGCYLAQVHNAGVLFRDAHPANVLVRNAPPAGEPAFSLIDLDALRLARPSMLERVKLLMKLGLPEPEQHALMEGYWQAADRQPAPLAIWFLERVYYPFKRVRRRVVSWARGR